VADWTGAGVDTSELYRLMAQRELHGVSPTYEALCLAVADDRATCGLIDQLPEPKRQPNLLLGATRYLDGPIHDRSAFLRWVGERWADIATTMRARRTQTNEPARCTALLPALAGLPQPIALVEVGASAGLCLLPDRYGYDYTADHGEHTVIGDSEIVLRCSITGPVPLPDRPPQIAWRAGLDLNPLDAGAADDRRWLSSLVWPEQIERADRLGRALDAAATDPPRVVAGDLLTDLPALVAAAPTDAHLVIWHSAVLAYLPPRSRARFVAVIDELRTHRRLTWVTNEAPGVIPGTELDRGRVARFVLAVDQRPFALAAPHGTSLDWLPASTV